MTPRAKQPGELRTGYTTGTCAAGAAKAAAMTALGNAPPLQIIVTLPSGAAATLPLVRCERTDTGAVAAIRKDGGDDPDITTGLLIHAQVTLNESGCVTVGGGEGVGRVTLKGLKVPVGEAAINPVPRQMIEASVRSVLPDGCGADVVIFVPGGDITAKRTFNPKLGVVGGISILGSTGIVNPMSEAALKESLRLELNVRTAAGRDTVVFAFGNYGLHFLQKHDVPMRAVIKISNYIGFMLDCAVEQKVSQILLIGHIGKLVKVSGGIFQTHSRMADCRLELLCAYAALEGAAQETVQRIYESKTTIAAVEILEQKKLQGVYRRIVDSTVRRCRAYTYDQVAFGCILFGEEDRMLYLDEGARQLLQTLQAEKE